jgi:phage baseplate assembly protein gpV
MTRMICDTCRKEEPPENSLAPVGWFTVWRRRGGSDHHFCSPACAEQYFVALKDTEAQAAAVVAAQTPAAPAGASDLRLQ